MTRTTQSRLAGFSAAFAATLMLGNFALAAGGPGPNAGPGQAPPNAGPGGPNQAPPSAGGSGHPNAGPNEHGPNEHGPNEHGHGPGHHHGHGHWGPQYRTVYKTIYVDKEITEFKTITETRFRKEWIMKYREEHFTVFIDKPCVVEKKVTDYKRVAVDKGHFVMKPSVDHCGHVCFKKVWMPHIEYKLVPCERIVKETIIKKVPIQKTRMVPCQVEIDVPYKVTLKVPCKRIIKVPVKVAHKVPVCPPKPFGRRPW
jgi:hypothetical protein